MDCSSPTSGLTSPTLAIGDRLVQTAHVTIDASPGIASKGPCATFLAAVEGALDENLTSAPLLATASFPMMPGGRFQERV